MPRYRHWKNFGEAGDTVFVTSTALGHVPVFAAANAKAALLRCLVAEHRNSGSMLHAYVIMSTHVHFVTTLSSTVSVTEFVRRLKINSAKAVRPLLDPVTAGQLAAANPRTPNSVWIPGFRGKVVRGPAMFTEDVAYIHNNPVTAKLCALPEEYEWSSARISAEGLWDPDVGLPLDRIL